ncbi:MAG TPA: hypothetical protein VLC92_18905 [Rhodocyclaceae bacterium]|nr:hypothetical protein [Rhodocyclaceae bacterium]
MLISFSGEFRCLGGNQSGNPSNGIGKTQHAMRKLLFTQGPTVLAATRPPKALAEPDGKSLSVGQMMMTSLGRRALLPYNTPLLSDHHHSQRPEKCPLVLSPAAKSQRRSLIG